MSTSTALRNAVRTALQQQARLNAMLNRVEELFDGDAATTDEIISEVGALFTEAEEIDEEHIDQALTEMERQRDERIRKAAVELMALSRVALRPAAPPEEQP